MPGSVADPLSVTQTPSDRAAAALTAHHQWRVSNPHEPPETGSGGDGTRLASSMAKISAKGRQMLNSEILKNSQGVLPPETFHTTDEPVKLNPVGQPEALG